MKFRRQQLAFAVALLIVTGLGQGCAEYHSRPARVDAHFGEAVREMRVAQTYDARTRQNPNPNPIMRRDGRKSQQIMDQTYRRDVWQIQEKRQDTDRTFYRAGGRVTN